MINLNHFKITDGSLTYYGGDQGWWGNARFFFGIQKKETAGCAAIAATNLAKYLARDDVRFAPLFGVGDTKDEYMQIADRVWKTVSPSVFGMWWKSAFARSFVRYARSCGADLEARCFGARDTNAAARFIHDALDRGIPPVIGVHFNRALRARGQCFERHWMVVTAVTEGERPKITVLSWGGVYELDLRCAVMESSYYGLVAFNKIQKIQ